MTAVSARSTPVLAVLLLVLLAHQATARVPIACSVRLFAPLEQYAALCKSIITKAAAVSRSNAINFLPTQHYVDNNRDAIPDYYCVARGPLACETANAASIKRFETAMATCFKIAYSKGFRVFEITPRLDDSQMKSWRNDMRFDPDQKYNSVSYRSLLIAPIIRALNQLPKRTIYVYFNLQGEMNGPLITHPQAWKALGDSVRRFVKAKSTKVGLNLNFNKICSWCTGYNFSPNGANFWEQFDMTKIQQLFSSMDFVGMSAYAPLWVAGDSYAFVTPEKIENSIWIAANELKAFGVDLKALNKPIHYSEYGLGGGTCETANCPATNSAEVSKSPYFGISGPYNANMDPWKVPDNRNFRAEFYKQTIKYAATYGTHNWKVEAIYIWCHGSYDIYGVYPGSNRPEGSWADNSVINMLRDYNSKGTVPS